MKKELTLVILLGLIAALIFVYSKTFSTILTADEYDTYDTWDGVSISSSFAGGAGTEADPYQISSGAELMYFKSLIEGSSSTTYNKLFYILTNNINLNSKSFSAIGNPVSNNNYSSNTNVFKGYFDGDGHSLANGVITEKLSSSNEYYLGLFAMIEDASVVNVNLKSFTITLSDKTSYQSIYAGTLIGSSLSNTKTTISNCGIYDTNINIVDISNIGGVLGYQAENTFLNTIYVNADITSNSSSYVGNIVGYSVTTDKYNIENSIIYNNEETNIYGYSESSSYNEVYLYTYLNSTISVSKYLDTLETSDKTLADLSLVLTSSIDGNFTWSVYNEYLRFDNDSSINSMINSKDYGTISFSPSVTVHSTGIDNNIVYTNDLESDFNYYIGLNYTDSDGYLPSGNNSNKYNKKNLVPVKLTYSSSNLSDTLKGYVSLTERQDTYIYYKTYNVNDNGTSDPSDDYITIELIDNPFTDRPTDMAFNGWVTNYLGAEISYDSTTYTRYVNVPVAYTNSNPNEIVIDIHASWINAKVTNINSSTTWSTAFGNLNTAGMTLIDAFDYVYEPYDMTGYYTQIIVSRGQSRIGYYSSTGTLYTSGTCTSTTCTYYRLISNEYYNEAITYYYLSNRVMYILDSSTLNFVVAQTTLKSSFNGTTSGFYRTITLNYGDSLKGFYNSSGVIQTSGTCTSTTCTYYELIQFYNNGTPEQAVDDGTKYYYLVTRDTNIVVMNTSMSNTWASAQSKPFTLTSVYNGTDYRSSVTWTVSTVAVRCYNDTTIENIKINSSISKTTGAPNPPSGSSSTNFYGGWFNVKLGRGITQSNSSYTNFATIMGGYSSSVGSSSNVKKYKFIVESGVYNAVSLSSGIVGTSYTMYIKNSSIYGNDYDKANSDDSNLEVVYCASGSWGGIYYSASSTDLIFDLTVKSGSFGTNKYDYTTGIYVGGRYGGTHNAARKIVYEGGTTYNVIGGPLTASNRSAYNDSYIYVKGGTIDMITAGAGSTATYGNRIIQLTGGTVNYSVFGGSNGYQGTSGDGTVNGSSFIYVGGNSVIGNSTNVTNGSKLYGAEAGSIFGIGNGNSSYSSIGSNDNSNIIIDGNTSIKGNVYGGGNYGTTGISSAYSTTKTNISILNGTIDGSVYGGGNNNGAGSSTKAATINLKMLGGKIKGSLYGGSNQLGTIYGDVNVNFISGTVNGSIYGGGKGGYLNSSNIGTYVSGNVYVTIGNKSYNNSPLISGSVYGGSAYGVVNGTTRTSTVSTKTTNLTVNNGNLTSVYGGGEGNGTYTPYVCGNINVNVYGGKITNVYGGNDRAGKPNGTISLNLNDGVLTNVYGGGNFAESNSTKINLLGSTIQNLYGGGNSSGASESNVDLKKGSVTNVYGGSNQSGTVTKSNITANESNTNLTSALSMNVKVNASDIQPYETVDYLSYENLEITIANNSSTNIVRWDAIITTSNSKMQYNYTSTEVTENNSSYSFNEKSRWYGTNPVPANGTYTFNFGIVSYVSASNFEIVSTTIIGYDSSGNEYKTVIDGLKVENIFGGNNAGGTTTNSNINLNNIKIANVYGGGNYANISNNTSLIINNTTISGNIYGGGNNGAVLGSTSLNIKNSTIDGTIFGGGNQGDVSGNTDVVVGSSTINNSVYGGGNAASVTGNTNVIIGGTSNIKESVFGGGNSGTVGDSLQNSSNSKVNIIGGTIFKNVYGGCNTSIIYGTTTVNIGSSALNGGLSKGNVKIMGTIFGGGEANASGSDTYDFSFISVTDGIDINIDGTGYSSGELLLSGSIFGSGNASSSSGDSNISINSIGTKTSPIKAISIQRATEVVINNSTLELVGTTDRTNEYSSIKYSLNRIDLLKIKNGTTLLLQQNANLLKELKSMADEGEKEVSATVTIDSNGNTTRNTNNRIYILANKNLNVTTNESATAYGQVTGMTFLGMYNAYSNGSYSYGIYNMENNDVADAGDVIIGGSYILGLHPLNSDTEKNGFYTNYIDEEYTHVTAKYISPTPDNANYYIWAIGLDAINYSFSLTASKYSSLGTYELSLIDFADGNTTFEVLGFNSEGLTNGVSLVDSNNVPKIGTTDTANSVFGLSMKAETTEWTSNDTTKFISQNSGSYTGSNSYLTDNDPTAPSLIFYLYHAKNINLDSDIGTVVITLQARKPINEIEFELSLITITIDINARTYSDAPAYDASITYGKKYEMPSVTDVNITTNSSFTSYFSLYASANNMSDIYGLNNNYYHTLSSSYAFPTGTKITMIDLGANETNPKYYYYIVDQADYTNKVAQLNSDNEATYNINQFKPMDSVSSNNKYNDATENSLYYHDSIDLVIEEFIFVVDFSNAIIPINQLNNSLIFELRTQEARTNISVLGIRQDIMKYNLYQKTNVVLNSNLGIDDNYLYYDISKNISYDVLVGYNQTENRQSIIDTNYESSSMGINISIFDSSNSIVSSTMLVGSSIKMGDTTYYAGSDGVFRIKLSNKVSNINKVLKLIVSENLPSGNYVMKIDLFASSDGLHKGSIVDKTTEINLTVVGENNSIDSSIDDKSKIVDGLTGNSLNGSNLISTTINYDSVLTNPNIRVAVYKRNTSSYLDATYTEIDLRTIVSTTLAYPAVYGFKSGSEYEYMVLKTPIAQNTFGLKLKQQLASGTYKLVYRLYDLNQLIDYDEEYIIVKK